MKPFNLEDALFTLSETQQTQYEQLHYCEFYFHLLRQEFLDKPYIHYCMADLWVYFYYEELPFVHSENTLIFLLRHYILDTTVKNTQFQRIKKGTVDRLNQSLLAAASVLNIYLDQLRVIYSTMPQEQLHFYEKFSTSKRLLFDQRFSGEEHYPKQLVQIETYIIQQLRAYTSLHQLDVNERIVEVKKLIDQVVLIERDFFNTSL